MTTYIVKLVDHRNSSEEETLKVKASVARIFGLAFDGTKDGVSVAWGAGASGNNLVIHFVEDIANSVLVKKWPQTKIDPAAGGHTHSHGALSGTELYRNVPTGRSGCVDTAPWLSTKRCTTCSRFAMMFTPRWAAA